MNKKVLIIITIILALIPIYFMNMDVYFSGDEVITYNMVNNDKAGFVFSDGRLAGYMLNEVFNSDDAGVVLGNLKNLAVDVIENGRNSKLLTAERDPEVRLYTKEEMTDWFAKRSDERFNLFDTWIHSLGDDGGAWQYEFLINIVASILLPISSTKWVAFVVNYIFYLLTLFVLFKIGRWIGNSDRCNYLAIICLCLWYVSIHTVTNLRAYQVASFWTALLVLCAIKIHSDVMRDHGTKTSDHVKLVVVYALGFVTHYTIGAVLTTFGVTLVVFMLVGKKKNVGKVIATGILSLVAGMLLAPDSIVDLLNEYSNKGAVDMPREMYGYMAIIIVLLVALIIHAIRHKDSLSEPYYYASFATVLCFAMVTYGTNRVGYAKIAYPIAFLLAASTVIRVITERGVDSDKEGAVNVALAMLILCFGVANLVYIYNFKVKENNEVLPKRTVLETVDEGTCIYFREHARGYKDAVLLRDYFEKAQVITVDTDNWQDMVEYDGEDNKVICYFSDELQSQEALNWVRSLGYNEFVSIYSDGDTNMYLASK